MIRKLVSQQKINNFHVQGKLVDDPVKELNEDNQIIVFFKIKTRFNNTTVTIPMIITGRDCDVFATKYAKGDQIVVDGMFISINQKTHLWVTNHSLVKKNTKPKEVEDRFQKVVELYSLEGIERREKKNNGKK